MGCNNNAFAVFKQPLARIAVGLALLAGLLAVAPVAGEDLFHWVDSDGAVHYTDHVPPEQVEQGHATLNSQGVRTSRVPPAPTPEERAQARVHARTAQALAEKAERQRQADARLRKLYRSSDDIDLALQGRLRAMDALIQVERDRARAEQNRLLDLTARLREAPPAERVRIGADDAGNAVVADDPPADELQARIARSRRDIIDIYSNILLHEEQKNHIRAEFAGIQNRYLAMRGGVPQRPTAIPREPRLPNLVYCDTLPVCTRLWGRALEYVRRQAAVQRELTGPGLLIVFARDDEEQRRWTLTWTQPTADRPVRLYLDLECQDNLTASLICRDQQAEAARDGFADALARPLAVPAPAQAD